MAINIYLVCTYPSDARRNFESVCREDRLITPYKMSKWHIKITKMEVKPLFGILFSLALKGSVRDKNRESMFTNIYSVVGAEVSSNPFSLNRGVIAVWVVTFRQCWIRLVLNSWSEGNSSWQVQTQALAVQFTQTLLCPFLNGLLLKQHPVLCRACIDTDELATARVRAMLSLR